MRGRIGADDVNFRHGVENSIRVKKRGTPAADKVTASKKFQANGFHRTSMAGIAARAGCSKVTLYGYFEAKNQPYFAAIGRACRQN